MKPIRRVYILQPFLKDGNHTYYGVIKEGRRIIAKRSLKTALKKDAEQWKAKEQSKILFHQSPSGEIEAKDPREAIKEYRQDLHSLHHDSPATLSAYSNYIRQFESFFKDTDLDFTVEKAQRFVSYLSTKGYAPKTINEIVKFCRMMFKKWQAYKFVASNPFADPNLELPRIIRNERAFWLPEEVNEIIEKKATPDLKALWALQTYAGLRPSEAYNLTFECIDFERRIIKVRLGKGKKDREVAMNDYLAEILQKEKAKYKSGHCFPLLPRTNYGRLKRLKKLIGDMRFKIPGAITQHRFRHSFASNLIRKGANIKQVQRLLGHSGIQTTLDTYAHLIQEDMNEAVSLINPPGDSATKKPPKTPGL
jgi:site-specific recombinase XerD